MPKQVQLRRGTTAQTATFTGALGEATVDTTKKTLVVHDGTTAGGAPLSKEADLTILTTRVGAFGTVTRLSDGVIPINALVKFGSDAAHVAVSPTTFGGAQIVIGVARTAATGAGQTVIVSLLGLAQELPLTMIADAAIAGGAWVEPSALTAGYVHTMTGAIGNHCVCGIALSAALVSGDLITVSPGLWLRVI